MRRNLAAVMGVVFTRIRMRCCSRSGLREAKAILTVDLTFMAGRPGDVTVVVWWHWPAC